MIDQHTDGLSRGLRLASGRLKWSPKDEVCRIFEGVSVMTAMVSQG
jgi:hypothetical protein